MSGPGIDVIRKHEGNCQVAMDLETLTRLGTHIDSPIKDANVINSANGLKLGEINKFVAGQNLGNGKADGGATELNGHATILIKEQDNNLGNGVTENGSKSHHGSEKKSGNRSTGIENEIQEYGQLKPEESNKIFVEYDVEKVIEEQETHDLFCPNCQACITKRVILRKRKRTQTPAELPPQEDPDVTLAIPAPNEPPELVKEPAITCFSCLKIFIPTECGFSILQFLWRGDGSSNLNSEHEPTKGLFSNLFGAGSSKSEGAPLPSATNKVPSGEQSSGSKQRPSLSSTLDTADPGEKGTTSGLDNAGVRLPAESNKTSGGDPSLGSKENLPPVVTPVAAGLGEKGSTNGMTNAGSYSNGGIIGNWPHGEEESYPTSSVPEGNGTIKPIDLGWLHGRVYPSDYVPPENAVSKPASTSKPASPMKSAVRGPETPADTRLELGVQGVEESIRHREWDVLKSIVYGGLTELITSLGIVSSAAGSGSSTLNICALGLANLVGGLFLISHDISELKSAHDAEAASQRDERAGRYWEKLGKRKYFRRHVFFAILSYIIFGVLPPLIYGFSFRESDNKEYKLMVVASASLFFVALLAIGKAHVRPQKGYIKSLFYYLGIAAPASGLSYVAGVMIDRLFVEFGLFDTTATAPSPPSSVDLLRFGSGGSSWASV